MQLTRALALALLALVAALVSMGEAAAQPPADAPPSAPARTASKGSALDVVVGSDLAAYGDTDHVFIFTPSIAGSVTNPLAGWSVNADYLVDVVSAASVDIVSTASRSWKEVRHAGALGGSYKPGALGVAGTATVSSEPDYLALSMGGNVSQDLFNKSFTWLAGYNYGHEVAGRTGTPFSVFSHLIDRHAFKLGATLLLDRATITSFVGDLMLDRGDQSKPYRFVPLFTPGQQLAPGASGAEVARLRTPERPLEQVPLSRERYALSGRLAHRFRASTLRLDERLYLDSWGMKASSTDARYLIDVGRVEVGPHLRAHAQTPVSFFRRQYFLGPGYSYPALRTGDRELGPLVNLTAGGSVGIGVGPRARPRSLRLGADLNGTWTRYLDDLYVTQRFSLIGGLSVEAEL
ncbi:MAG: DUF3570 domain-containing protein [Minicystis sp.]